MHIFPFTAWGSAPPPPPPLSRGWPRTHTRRPSGAGLPSGPSQTDLSSRPPCACASHPPDTRPPARILLRLCCPLWAAPASLRAGGTPQGAFSVRPGAPSMRSASRPSRSPCHPLLSPPPSPGAGRPTGPLIAPFPADAPRAPGRAAPSWGLSVRTPVSRSQALAGPRRVHCPRSPWSCLTKSP